MPKSKLIQICSAVAGLLAVVLVLLLFAELASLASWMEAVRTRVPTLEVEAIHQKLLMLAAALVPVSLALVGLSLSGQIQSAKLRAIISKRLRQLVSQPGDVVSDEDAVASLDHLQNQLSAELYDLRQRQKLLVEKAVDVICVVDMKGNFVSVSGASRRAWGYEPKELTGRPLGFVLEGEHADQILHTIVGAAKSIDRVVFESKLRCKDGSLVDVVWTGHWSATEGGLFCIVHDISQQKLIEKTIRESEHRLRVALESLPVGVLATNKNGQIEFANVMAQRSLLAQPEQLVGVNVSSVFEYQSLTTAELSEFETNAKRSDGQVIPANVWISTIELAGAEKKLIAFLDVSAKYELEKMKQEFIAMITHDLRSPLTSVQGVLLLMQKGVLGQLNEQGEQMTRRVQNECERLIRLLNDMLQVHKMELGNFDLECAPVDLSITVKDAVENVRALASDKEISMQLHLENSLCMADEQRIMQVMMNLLSNAIKYAPERSCVQVSMNGDPQQAFITVEDQGRGIPEEKVDLIFEKFGLVDPDDAKKRGGTGLGLAICKAIVTQHGGQIGVHSTIGKGSKFWFTVPKLADK
jgi:PAS domain S-box-containing protein